MSGQTEETINDRLRFLLGLFNMKAGQFSRELGISETTVRNYVDRTSKPSSDVIEKIVKRYTNVNLEWLVTGLGPPLLDRHRDYDKNPEKNRDVIREAKENYDQLRQHFVLDSQHELEMCKKEVEALRAQLEAQSNLVATKDALIAAKDEMLSLLRESKNSKR
jgi:predicted transcriptional regulator